MTKKFKLIRSFPYSPEVGSIGIQISNTDIDFNAIHRYGIKEVESSPEFFAPYLFTDELGNDVYAKDEVTFVNIETNKLKDTIGAFKGMWTTDREKIFSSKDAAQNWIDSQRTPIWKTEDGEDVFDGDTVSWVICSYNSKQWEYVYDLVLNKDNLICVKNQPEIYKVFKNKDKMNTWIEEQNEPKYEDPKPKSYLIIIINDF